MWRKRDSKPAPPVVFNWHGGSSGINQTVECRSKQKGAVMMKILLGTTMFAGLLVAGAAQAADMPLKAPRAAPYVFSWTGCYIGGNVGGAWARQDAVAVAPL